MITAMGVAGIEGPYRKAAELTLKVMRQNSETLISVLRPIMFDATAKDRQTEKSSQVEFINKSVKIILLTCYTTLISLSLQVVSSLKRVQLRLAGYLNDTTNEELTAMSLSPEGHAKAIIRQASDINNLCQMYPGWGAFL
jgi:serine/threonine-protein kinase ATR